MTQMKIDASFVKDMIAGGVGSQPLLDNVGRPLSKP
jgi:hypothetical protein